MATSIFVYLRDDLVLGMQKNQLIPVDGRSIFPTLWPGYMSKHEICCLHLFFYNLAVPFWQKCQIGLFVQVNFFDWTYWQHAL